MPHEIPNESQDPRVIIEFSQSTQSGREGYRVHVVLPIGEGDEAEGVVDQALELAETARKRALGVLGAICCHDLEVCGSEQKEEVKTS